MQSTFKELDSASSKNEKNKVRQLVHKLSSLEKTVTGFNKSSEAQVLIGHMRSIKITDIDNLVMLTELEKIRYRDAFYTAALLQSKADTVIELMLEVGAIQFAMAYPSTNARRTTYPARDVNVPEQISVLTLDYLYQNETPTSQLRTSLGAVGRNQDFTDKYEIAHAELKLQVDALALEFSNASGQL